LKEVKVDENSAMVLCIPERENEGICPTVLTQWLVARHNELVQVVSVANRDPPRKVSSRLLGAHDVIKYDADALLSFLRSRCVTYGEGGKLLFDLTQLERRLRREMSRPEIVLELREFQWLGESYSKTFELREVMKQKDLPEDVTNRIRSELTNVTLAHTCLQKVSMSVNFILKAGGAGLSEDRSSDMLLHEYMRTVLCETGIDTLPSATARAEVHLVHIDAFAKLLKVIIKKDPMDKVDTKYKRDIPEELLTQIKEVQDRLPASLADVLAQTGEQYLSDDAGIGEDSAMVPTLEAFWDADDSLDPQDLKEIKETLPEGLLMKHWAALYRTVKPS
jgi:hypothetical protein